MKSLFIQVLFLQYGLPMLISLVRADDNLPLCRAGLKEVLSLQLLIWKIVRLLDLTDP